MYTPFKVLTYSRNISPSRFCLFFASLLQNSPWTSSVCCVGSAIKGSNRMNRTFVDLAQDSRTHRFSIPTDFSLYTTSFHSIENLRNPSIRPKNYGCAYRRFCSSKLAVENPSPTFESHDMWANCGGGKRSQDSLHHVQSSTLRTENSMCCSVDSKSKSWTEVKWLLLVQPLPRNTL